MRKASLSYVEELELVEHTLVAIQRTAITIAELPAEDRSEALHEFGRAYAIAIRKSFERVASQKSDRGHVELDGSVCIRALAFHPRG